MEADPAATTPEVIRTHSRVRAHTHTHTPFRLRVHPIRSGWRQRTAQTRQHAGRRAPRVQQPAGTAITAAARSSEGARELAADFGALVEACPCGAVHPAASVGVDQRTRALPARGGGCHRATRQGARGGARKALGTAGGRDARLSRSRCAEAAAASAKRLSAAARYRRPVTGRPPRGG